MTAAAGRTAVALLALALAARASGASPADRCEAKKVTVAGKYGACRLEETARAVRKGQVPEFTTCDRRYDQRWARGESRAEGECPTEGDAASMKTFLTEHADAVALALSGGGLPSCTECGNASVGPGEECDQADLGGATCVSRGFAGGTLACGSSCGFDTSGCFSTRFTDNHDGTITDHQTGLMWEKKVLRSQTTNFGNLHDSDNYYAWDGQCSGQLTKFCQPTAAASAACGTAFGCAECGPGEGTCSFPATIWTFLVALNASGFAGHSDWRIPTRDELAAILNYDNPTFPPVDAAFAGASCGPSCPDITNPLCSCTEYGPDAFASYWTSSGVSGSDNYAWTVVFRYGYVLLSNKPAVSFVRAVRGGP